MTTLLLVCALILLSSPIATAKPATEASLRILSYNIKGLPPIATPGYGTARFDEIARQLKKRLQNHTAPDVVLLQEAFTDDAKAVVTRSGYPHWAQGPSRNGQDSEGEFQKSFSSGLFILSRYPIVEAGHINFNRDHCATWDCYANKGMQYVKIQIPVSTRPLIVFNTHMQAGKKHEDVRQKQITTLINFMHSKLVPKVLFFFGGDFNTRPGMETYQTLQVGLGLDHAGEECLEKPTLCSVTTETPPNEIFSDTVDHIFFDRSGFFRVNSVSRNFREKFEDQFLSDHFGFEAEFRLNTP